jgi:hypothetical protein
MDEKTQLERHRAQVRLALVRSEHGQGEAAGSNQELTDQLAGLQELIAALDERIAPLAQASGELGNPLWGPIMRAGNDKSLFARQVERYADIYTSRASNFLAETPFGFLRAPRGSLPHDPN